MALFRLVLIAVLIYLFLKLIGRALFPWMYLSEEEKGNYSQSGKGGTRRKEGEVTLDDIRRQKDKIIQKDEGDYIDYEEIK